MAKFDFFARHHAADDWILIAESDIPETLKPQLLRGMPVTVKDLPYLTYRAVPRLPTTSEIVAAAHAVSRELTKARLNSDWFHPATQLVIEKAHNDFLQLFDLKIPPSIVSDPAVRKRWRPRPM